MCNGDVVEDISGVANLVGFVAIFSDFSDPSDDIVTSDSSRCYRRLLSRFLKEPTLPPPSQATLWCR